MACTAKKPIVLAAFIGLVLLSPINLRAEDWREKAGVAVGVGVGNSFYAPLKLTIAVLTVPQSLMAFITTGGDTEVAKQILVNGTEPPYAITRQVARDGVGQRLYSLDENTMARDSNP